MLENAKKAKNGLAASPHSLHCRGGNRRVCTASTLEKKNTWLRIYAVENFAQLSDCWYSRLVRSAAHCMWHNDYIIFYFSCVMQNVRACAFPSIAKSNRIRFYHLQTHATIVTGTILIFTFSNFFHLFFVFFLNLRNSHKIAKCPNQLRSKKRICQERYLLS